MKKIIIIFFLTMFFFSSSFVYARNITENEKIQLAMLMNQIQYTTSNIIQNKNKEILNQEFDFIISKIDKTKLYSEIIKNAYVRLLNSIRDLKLTENEKEFVITMNEREKKQAYTKAFSSFGSIFNGGLSPASLVTSLIYTGVSAGLNIIAARNEADNKLFSQLFQINQKELITIDNSRIALFKEYADVITAYKIPSKYEIKEDEMKDFIRQLANKQDSPKDLIRILENIKNRKQMFQYFPIFWYQLGAQYQLDNNIKKAIECYDRFEKLKKEYSYLDKDPYYICVAKNKIKILIKNINSNKQEILKYLSIIESNMVPENESENRVFMAEVYFSIGENKKAKDLLNINISREEFYSISSDLLALIEYDENKNINSLNPAFLLGLKTIKLNLDNNNDNVLEISVPKKIALDKFGYIIVNNIIYPNPYPLESNDNNVCKMTISFDLEKQSYEMVIGILSKNNKLIELSYDCNYLKKNKSVSKLLESVDIKIEDIKENVIEACLLPQVYLELNKFKYDAEKQQEYIDLVKKHNRELSKAQDPDKLKKDFKEEEEKKLEELKVNGKIKAINTLILDITKKLYEKPYFYSNVSVNKDGDLFCYSLKKVKYLSDVYKFDNFGISTKYKEKENITNEEILKLINLSNKGDKNAQYSLFKKYLTGDNVEQNSLDAYKFLIISAMNGCTDAQYELASVYDEPRSSKLAETFIDNSIFIPNSGFFDVHFWSIPQNNSTIEKEMIAFYWYKKAADNGYPKAVYKIAKRYEEGLGVKKDIELAKKYYHEAYYKYGILEAKEKADK